MHPNEFPINFKQLDRVHTLCRKVSITSNFKALDKYFNKHPDTINSIDGYGNTPLLLVIRYGQRNHTLDVINYLFDRGADPLIKNHQGYDSLMCSIIYNVSSAIQWFFDHKFEFTFTLKGYSVLELVAHYSPESIHLFLENKTWDQAIKDLVLQILVRNDIDCSPILEQGANSNVCELLSHCIKGGYHLDETKLHNFDKLLQYKAKLPSDVSFWKTISQSKIIVIREIFRSMRQHGWKYKHFLLYYYCHGMKYYLPSGDEFIQFIEENSFDLNLQDQKGNTCLHLLFEKEHFHVAKALVQKDALFLANNKGQTPFYNLMKIPLHSYYYPEPHKKVLIELCLEKGAPIEEAYLAINNLHDYYREQSKQFIDTLADKYPSVPIKEPEFN